MAFGSAPAPSAGRPSGNVLCRSSVASMHRFLLMLRNGEAADPPAFLTEHGTGSQATFLSPAGTLSASWTRTPRSNSRA
jgi:hypothetical protein